MKTIDRVPYQDESAQRIWAAVIDRALKDAHDRDKKLKDEAQWWLSGEDTGFANVCKALNLSPKQIRGMARNPKSPIEPIQEL